MFRQHPVWFGVGLGVIPFVILILGSLNVHPEMHRSIPTSGISLRGVANILNERRFETARGGKWQATTVRNMLTRSGDMKVAAE
jgi:Recombinase